MFSILALCFGFSTRKMGYNVEEVDLLYIELNQLNLKKGIGKNKK